MQTNKLASSNKDRLHKRVLSFRGLTKSFRVLSYISQLKTQLNSMPSATTCPNPQASGIFETDYIYQNPPAPVVLSEISNQIQTVTAEKEQLLEELQKLDQLTEEKAECECLEAKINQIQEEIADDEKLSHQMPQLKSNIFKLNRLENNIDTFQRGEMLILEQEVQNLGVAQEKWLSMTNCDIISLQSLLQESQTKEVQLKHELWTEEDMGKLSEYNVGKLEVSIASYVKKDESYARFVPYSRYSLYAHLWPVLVVPGPVIVDAPAMNDDQEKAAKGRLEFMQEALENASKTASGAGDLCKLLSHASCSPIS